MFRRSSMSLCLSWVILCAVWKTQGVWLASFSVAIWKPVEETTAA